MSSSRCFDFLMTGSDKAIEENLGKFRSEAYKFNFSELVIDETLADILFILLTKSISLLESNKSLPKDLLWLLEKLLNANGSEVIIAHCKRPNECSILLKSCFILDTKGASISILAHLSSLSIDIFEHMCETGDC